MELEAIQELDDEPYEEQFDELSMMIMFQKQLTTISEQTYEQVLQFFNNTPLANNPDFHQLIIDEIISAYSVRPWNLKLLAKFCMSLKSSEGFEEMLLAAVFKAEVDFRRIENMITKVSFLRECFKLGFTTIQTIITCITNFKRNYSNFPEEVFVFFTYFAPEIEATDKDLFNGMMEYFHVLYTKCRSPQTFQMYKQFENLRKDNWKGLLESIEFAGTSDSVQYVIRHDDLEQFKKICPNVNTRIHKSAFEQCAISQYVMVPLQYATLFSAIKIADYIISKNPDILKSEAIESGNFYDGRIEAVYDGKESPEYEQSIALAYSYISCPTLAMRYEQMNLASGAVAKYSAAFRANRMLVYEDPDSAECLFAAVKNNNLEAVINYKNSGAQMDCRSDNNTLPEHVAAENGHSYLLQVLLSFQQKDEFQLSDDENEEEESSKLKMGSDYFGRKPLHLAALCGQYDVVQVLVDMGADANEPDNLGRSALSDAALGGHAAIVDFLIKSGFDPNVKDKEGLTPLLIAAMNGRADVIHVLMTADNVDLKVTGEFGTNALHIAAQGNHIEVVEELLKSKKFSADCKDMIGRTPADFATSKEMLDVLSKKY